MVEKILGLAKRTILGEGAHALVFGCTGMSPVIDQVKRQFESISIKILAIKACNLRHRKEVGRREYAVTNC